MISKMPQISFIGDWDFLKVYLSKVSVKQSMPEAVAQMQALGIETSDAQKLYDNSRVFVNASADEWISKRSRFYTGAVPAREEDGMLYFDSGIVFNEKTQRLKMYDAYAGSFRKPAKVFYAENGTITELPVAGHDAEVGVLVYNDGKDFKSIQLDPVLAKSMFCRLYFLEGKGLSRFSLFTQKEDDGRFIRVYEIQWDKS
jgi:hypothetical protein